MHLARFAALSALLLCAVVLEGCSELARFTAGNPSPGPDGADGDASVDGADAQPPVLVDPSGFGGIAFAHVVDQSRRVRVYWHPADDKTTQYEIWSGTSRGDLGSKVSMLGKPSIDRVDIKLDPGIHYLRVIARLSDGREVKLDAQHSFELDLRPSTVHTIAAIARPHLAPPDSVALRRPRAIAVDSWGNLLFTPTPSSIAVWCHNDLAPYCVGRGGRIQTLSGRDGIGDGLDDGSPNPPSSLPADLIAHGVVTGIAVNSAGDIYFSDRTNNRISVVCFSGRGPCEGVRFGYLIELVDTSAQAWPRDLALDGAQNVLYLTNDGAVRAFCHEKSAPYCANVSSLVDPRVVVVAPQLGRRAVAVDRGFNVFFGDTNGLISALCHDTTVGLCQGQPAQQVLPLTSTSIGTDKLGSVVDLAVDGANNLVVAHSTQLTQLCAGGAGVCTNGKLGEHQLILNDTAGVLFGVGVDRGFSLYALRDDNIHTICASKGSLGCDVDQTAHDLLVGPRLADPAGIEVLSGQVGDVSALAHDQVGNIYFVDRRRQLVNVLCAGDQGSCSGRAPDRIYDIIGDTSAMAGGKWPLTGVEPLQTPLWLNSNIGASDLTVDAKGQLYVALPSLNVLAALCLSENETCATAALGKLIRVAGNFATGIPTSGGTRSTAPLVPLSVTTDRALNPVVGTPTQVVSVCLEASASCASGAADTLLVLAGRTSPGESLSDVLGTLSPLTAVAAIGTDPDGNLLFGTSSLPRLHLLCVNSNGRCASRQAGWLYQLAGNGNDIHVERYPPIPESSKTVSLGAIQGVAPSLAPAGPIVVSSAKRLRAFCVNSNGTLCAGVGAYQVAVVGGNATGEAYASGQRLDPQRSLGDINKIWRVGGALYVAASREGLKVVLGD